MEILEYLNQNIYLIREKGFYVICGFCITLCLMVVAQHLHIRRLAVAIRKQANVSDKLVEKTKELIYLLREYGLNYTEAQIEFVEFCREDDIKKTRISNN